MTLVSIVRQKENDNLTNCHTKRRINIVQSERRQSQGNIMVTQSLTGGGLSKKIEQLRKDSHIQYILDYPNLDYPNLDYPNLDYPNAKSFH